MNKRDGDDISRHKMMASTHRGDMRNDLQLDDKQSSKFYITFNFKVVSVSYKIHVSSQNYLMCIKGKSKLMLTQLSK